ncbi:uncharacterized protein LOC128202493 [Galleria mellonella]|uniref:Uncharacterized protein LOC128202493 n=1 Tax=Galleria mellonella TaxID=7137 RepID=A0ABM3N5Z1_GALME|nr:uncharacterized protein LOC128202493 [Galleria mellonella]
MSSHNVSSTTSHAEPSHVGLDRVCADEGDQARSLLSAQSKSRVSSLSVKARMAAAEAVHKRRQYEREAALARHLAEVEDAEYRAELEQISAEADSKGSRRSRSTSTRMTRTEQWRTLRVYKMRFVDPHEKPSLRFSSLQRILKRSCAHSNEVLRHQK